MCFRHNGYIRLSDLESFARRDASSLSGGERRRLALARVGEVDVDMQETEMVMDFW
ncbi:MAG: hypothetical protein KAH31_08845 [Candidatus Sabulitectum sp.]|nr:hypothetical protein [Candidatus Sabulitectum sp.]